MGIHDDSNTEDEKKRGSRVITFSDLAGDSLASKPQAERSRRKISYADPYFRMLDASHALLMEKKKALDIINSLPADIRQIITELEAIIKEISLSAMEDDFDYHTQLNRYYFHMMRIDRLSSVLSYRMSRFMKNRAAVEKYFGADRKNSYHSFVSRLSVLVSTADELTLSSNLFMDNMEKNLEIPEDLISKRSLTKEKTMEMTLNP